MKEKSDNDHIIQLKNFSKLSPRSSEESIGGILQSCLSQVAIKLNSNLSVVFENTDDSLFELAEKAENNIKQTEFFDGMREIRIKRSRIEHAFRDGIYKNFALFAKGKLTHGRKSQTEKQERSSFSLIQDSDLEESLAIDSMVTKTENRLKNQLHALNKRFSVATGGKEVNEDNNPVSPANITTVLHQSCKNLEVTIQVKIVFFKLFEKYVMSKLEELYDELNNLLINAGILPDIKKTFTKSIKKENRVTDQSKGFMEESAKIGNLQTNNLRSNDIESRIIHSIQQLLATKNENYSTSSSVDAYDRHELLGALTILQNDYQAGNNSYEVDDIVGCTKKKVIKKLKQISTKKKDQSINKEDSYTIDLVGMFFEYILTDQNIPTAIQAQLGRLQIPVLKVALLNPEFFAQSTHPARQLLNEFAEIAIGWTPEVDKDNVLFNKIEEVIDVILNDFDDNTEIFETQLNNLRDFSLKLNKKIASAEKRTVEMAYGQEKLQNARFNAAKEILLKLQTKALPRVVKTILRKPWANVLVLTMLRYGKNSNEYIQALKLADLLINSVTLNADKMHEVNFDEIEDSLRAGLALVAYHEQDIDELMSGLAECFEQPLEQKQSDKYSVINEKDEVLGQTIKDINVISSKIVDDDVINKQIGDNNIISKKQTLDENKPVATNLKNVTIGTWVEFIQNNGSKIRARLSWISPISAKYLFVNRKGVKVDDKSEKELTAAINDGKAVVLEETPLFERAMSAILDGLEKDQKK